MTLQVNNFFQQVAYSLIPMGQIMSFLETSERSKLSQTSKIFRKCQNLYYESSDTKSNRTYLIIRMVHKKDPLTAVMKVFRSEFENAGGFSQQQTESTLNKIVNCAAAYRFVEGYIANLQNWKASELYSMLTYISLDQKLQQRLEPATREDSANKLGEAYMQSQELMLGMITSNEVNKIIAEVQDDDGSSQSCESC